MNRIWLLLILLASTGLAGCQDVLAPRPDMTSVGANLNPGAVGPGGLATGPNGQKTNQLIAESLVMPPALKPASGSLWVPGSRQFFKDSRAHDVGDIVTIVVNESASAASNAGTDTSKVNNETAGLSGLLNFGSQLTKRGIPLTATGEVNDSSNRTFDGSGKTNRTDTLTANVAAVVKQILPNGLLVIEGQREVEVNYEKQIMTIAGIVRPEDITSTNTVPSSKIAEARIAYAGKGIVDDQQQPQYGVHWLDKILPF